MTKLCSLQTYLRARVFRKLMVSQ